MSENPVSGTNSSSNLLSIISLVCGGIAFILFPVVFGPIAIILAVIAKNKKESLANVALTVGILGTLVGMFLGAVFVDAFN